MLGGLDEIIHGVAHIGYSHLWGADFILQKFLRNKPDKKKKKRMIYFKVESKIKCGSKTPLQVCLTALPPGYRKDSGVGFRCDKALPQLPRKCAASQGDHFKGKYTFKYVISGRFFFYRIS